jgi:hypothetical protein
MPSALQDEINRINPRLLRLDNVTSYLRGDSNYYIPFPGPEWFTPSRIAAIHKKIHRIWDFATNYFSAHHLGSADDKMEIEVYYLHLIARYQFLQFGGDIGPDPQRVSKLHRQVRRPRPLNDWHWMLDFLSDRMFYWAKQHRMSAAQVEAMYRFWLLIRYRHKNRNENRSLQHANDMCPSRIDRQGRKPGARRRNRRSIGC